MRFNDFQARALATMARDLDPATARAVVALGLAGEAGEVADLVKKELGHGHPENREKVLEELGDILFYVAICAHEYGWTLEEVATHNNAKLARRYPNGFSTERSLHREDAA